MATRQETQKALQEIKQELFTLRDEIRLKIHLGTMELKERWQKVEERLANAELQASKLTETSRKATQELLADLRSIRRALVEEKPS